MKRRRFLQSLPALAAVPTLAAETPWKLHYMLASSMYGSLPLTDILPEVVKGGATAIELWPKKHGTQREEMDAIGHDKFAAMLKSHAIGFGGTTRYDLGPFKLTEEIAVVKKLGGKFIITGGSGEWKNITSTQLKANVKSFVEKMKALAALAAESGIEIGIENHINNLIDTPDSLRWLADEIRDLSGIGIALAPYHLPQDTRLLADLITHIGKKMTLFYAWEHGMGCMKPMPKAEELQQLPGRGKLDWKPLLQALKATNFTGPTEVFMHPTPRGIPIMPTLRDSTAEIVKAKAHLDTLVSTL